MHQVLSTEEVPARDRVAYWHDVICATFIQLDVTQTAVAGRYRGAVETTQAGPVRITRIRADPMVAERTRRHLGAVEEERCLLAIQLRGRTVGSQCGRQAVLRPGDLALFDSTRPYRVDFRGSDFDHLVLQFPRHALRRCGIEPGDVTARRVAVDSRMGRVASPFLLNLARVAGTIGPTTADRLGHMSIDLVAAALADVSGLDLRRPAPHGPEMLERIRLHMHLHLSDPHLAPASVAAAHSISLRHLHRLFAVDGTTFGQWLREERLRRCFEDLRSPQLAALSVAEIGVRWGIRDASTLSRAFRARYGLCPSEHRRAAAEAAAAGPEA